MNLKIFKIQKKFKKREHEPDPDFYWRIVLGATFVLVTIAVVFGIYMFIKTNNQDFSGAVDYDGQGKKISKERIDAVLQYFSDRADKSQTIINSPSPVIDPSR